MRHEIKDSKSLTFTLEVILGGVGVPGLFPQIIIKSIGAPPASEYYENGGGGWSTPGAWPSAGHVNTMQPVGVPFVGLYKFTIPPVAPDFNPVPGGAGTCAEGYLVGMFEPVNNIMEYILVTVTETMVVSSMPVGVVDANVIDWNGLAATLTTSAGYPDINVKDWGGTGAGVSISASGLPDVNVGDWGGAGTATIDHGGLGTGTGNSYPNINVADYASEAVISSVIGMPDVNVMNWRIQTAAMTINGVPDVNVVDWNNKGATLEVGLTSGYPSISAGAWQHDGGAGLQDFYVQSSVGGDAVGGDDLPAITVAGWGGESAALFETGDPSDLPAISTKAWHDDGIAASNSDGYVKTSDGSDGTPLPAITVEGWAGSSTVLLDENAVSHYPLVDASEGTTLDVNIVDWNGKGATLDIGVTSGFPVISTGGWLNDGSVDYADFYVQSSDGGDAVGGDDLPAITVAGWGGESAALFEIGDTSDLPAISTKAWHSDGSTGEADFYVQSSDGGDEVGGDALPAITVAGWGGDEDAIFDIGDETKLPSITVKGWNDTSDGSNFTETWTRTALGGTNFTDTGAAGFEGLLPAIAVEGWGGDEDAAFEISHGDNDTTEKYPNIVVRGWGGANSGAKLTIGPNMKLPNITVKAWSDEDGGLDPDGNPLGMASPGDDIATTWTRDSNPTTGSHDLPNLRTQIIADNAIDEAAISIDSVTYEEISSSAVAEIVEGVWNADVRSPIDDSGVYDGSSYKDANPGSMGHAILANYVSQHTLHHSDIGGGETMFSPGHQCSVNDPTGTKFYSFQLNATPLSAHQIPAYIDRTAVVTRGWDPTDSPEDYEQYLVRISDIAEDGDGWYFVLHMVDEDESSIPNGFSNTSDFLIVKGETDPTMHEIAHEVWEESVFDHETPDTFGMFNRIMAGLTQLNHQITDSHYDESGRLLSCRLVVYPSSEDARDGTNALTTIEVTSTYDEKQNMQTFIAAEEPESSGS